jgi:hypothetical protein
MKTAEVEGQETEFLQIETWTRIKWEIADTISGFDKESAAKGAYKVGRYLMPLSQGTFPEGIISKKSWKIFQNALWREESIGATFIDQTPRIQKLSSKSILLTINWEANLHRYQQPTDIFHRFLMITSECEEFDR